MPPRPRHARESAAEAAARRDAAVAALSRQISAIAVELEVIRFAISNGLPETNHRPPSAHECALNDPHEDRCYDADFTNPIFVDFDRDNEYSSVLWDTDSIDDDNCVIWDTDLEDESATIWNDEHLQELGDLPALQDGVIVVGCPIGADAISATCGEISQLEIPEVEWQKMEHPDLRLSVGMQPNPKGVRINRIDPTYIGPPLFDEETPLDPIEVPVVRDVDPMFVLLCACFAPNISQAIDRVLTSESTCWEQVIVGLFKSNWYAARGPHTVDGATSHGIFKGREPNRTLVDSPAMFKSDNNGCRQFVFDPGGFVWNVYVLIILFTCFKFAVELSSGGRE